MPTEINFYPSDASVTSEGVFVFGYTQDKKKIAVFDAKYFPWLALAQENVDGLRQICNKLGVEFKHTQNEGNLTKGFFNIKDFDKVAREARQLNLYNSDISLRKRWWIDRKILPFTLTKAIGEPLSRANLKVDMVLGADFLDSLNTSLDTIDIVGFDFETSSSGAFPDPELNAIISIALYSNNFRRVITWKRFAPHEPHVTFVDSEAELIEEFVRSVNELKPHILAGYGSDNFDMPYLIRRAKKYDIELELNWDKSELSLKRSGHRTARVVGISYCDVSHFIRRILALDTDHYSLDLVAKKMLGKGKLAGFNAKRINEIWSVGLPEELALLCDYNLIDAQLAQELAKKILPVQMELCKLTGQPLHDVNLMTYGTLVEWFVIKNADIFIPPRPKEMEVAERQRHSYEGGLVVEPIPGLYKDICAFDFRSLYPSIIASHNISPETMDCSCCGVRGGFAIKEESIWFCSKKQGFVPKLVGDLVERRKRINDILAATSPSDASFSELMARQHALKFIAAAFYGYLGFGASRFYSFDCAKAVTSLGRKYIQMVLKEANKLGFKILYGDTDSLFVVMKNDTDAEAKSFLQIINSILPAPMELEFKAKYRSGIFLGKKSGEGGAKKRYALLTQGNSLILRGLEAIRGDWSNLAKRTQKEILQILLAEQDAEKGLAHFRKITNNVKTQKTELEDLAIRIKLTRPLQSYATNAPHVVAAKLAKAKGHPVRRGFLVSYVRTKGPDKVRLLEDCKKEDYDADYYIEHQLLRAVYKIFEIFGYGLEKLKAGQTTLEGY